MTYVSAYNINKYLRYLLGVLNAADYYDLDELRAACTGFADTGGGITVDTACALLASAERYIHYKCTKSLVQKVRSRNYHVGVFWPCSFQPPGVFARISPYFGCYIPQNDVLFIT